MKEWFALHTRPYSERKVALRLEHYEIDTYVPERRSESGRADATPLPFFPGYMFIRLDLDAGNPNHWRNTPGVRYLVSYGDEPIAVGEELIRAIVHQVAALDDQRRQRGKFQPGDQVRITDGPLKDMVAIFDGPSEPAERVQILLEVLSRYKRVRVAASSLEKVTPKQEKPRQKRPRRTRGRGRRIRS